MEIKPIPEGHDGEWCQRCGKAYDYVWLLPSSLWDQIHENFNLLCFDCVNELATNKGLFLFWTAANGEYPVKDVLKGV